MNFQEYIQRIGYSTAGRNAEDIAMVKAEYRRFYQRNYHKNYRKWFKRLEIQFALTEFQNIEKIAESYGEKPSTFIRKAVLCFLESETYVPSKNSLDDIAMLIRRSSNNINQLVYSSHRNQVIYKENLQTLVTEVSTMEQNLRNFYQKPTTIYKPINIIRNLENVD